MTIRPAALEQCKQLKHYSTEEAAVEAKRLGLSYLCCDICLGRRIKKFQLIGKLGTNRERLALLPNGEFVEIEPVFITTDESDE